MSALQTTLVLLQVLTLAALALWVCITADNGCRCWWSPPGAGPGACRVWVAAC